MVAGGRRTNGGAPGPGGVWRRPALGCFARSAGPEGLSAPGQSRGVVSDPDGGSVLGALLAVQTSARAPERSSLDDVRRACRDGPSRYTCSVFTQSTPS